MTPTISLFLLILLVGCRAQSVAQLPTRAALSTLSPSPAPLRQLEFWTAADGELLAPGQVDQWRFEAQAGDPIQINAIGVVQLSLYGPDGAPLGRGQTLEATLPSAGTYRLEIVGDPGAYQIGLAYTDRPNPLNFTATPPPMTIGVPTPTPVFSDLGLFIDHINAAEPITETFLASPVQPHVYTFEGRAEEYITVEMSRISGTVDPELRLYDPAGAALAVDHNSGGSRAALLRNIRLRSDGLYSIQANGGDVPGDYQITLTTGERPIPVTPTIIAPPTRTPAPLIAASPLTLADPGESLRPYSPVLSRIAESGDFQRHSIEASEGDFITINARALQSSTALRPRFEVYDPAGDLVGAVTAQTSNAAGDTQLTLLPITESGVYSVFVTAESGGSGEYVISYGLGPHYENQLRGTVVADTPYDSQILRQGARDVWTVLLNAGDSLTVSASPLNAALDPVLELYAPDGTLIASDDNSGGYPNALMNGASAPESGEYKLIVSAASGATAGPYRLVWRYVNIAPTPTYDAPRILLFSVEDSVLPGEYLFYPFQGTAGQQVRIRVIGGVATGFDPVAALIGPNGELIAEGDDSQGSLNPHFSADLPTEGTYQVRVNGYLSGGPFELIVERLF